MHLAVNHLQIGHIERLRKNAIVDGEGKEFTEIA